MGLLRATGRIFDLIYNEGLKEWLDETKYFEDLDELNCELENGKITEEEYEEKEAGILKMLKEVRNYKKENNL